MNKNKLLVGGELKALESDGSNTMRISGWASTDGIDYSKEIVEPSAFKKTIEQYKRKGRLWFNHDHEKILGRVTDIEVRENGLFINEAVLADTEFNRSYIFPLIKEGALNEFSIQFRSLKGEYKKGIYHHMDCELIEVSIVSVACNPEAELTGFKGVVDFPEWINAVKDLPNKEETPVATSDSTMKTQTNNFIPDFNGFEIIKNDETKYNAEGDGIPFPSKNAKNYIESCDLVFLAKRNDTYLFKVAELTEIGYKYNFENVALSFGDVLGAKGGYLIDNETRVNLIKSFIDIYAKLEKRLPELKGESLDKLTDEALAEIRFKDLEFFEDEKSVVESYLVNRNVNELKTIAAHEERREEVLDTVKKYLFSSLGLHIECYPSSSEEIDMFKSMLDMLNSFYGFSEEESEDMYRLSSQESVDNAKKFANYILRSVEDFESKKAEINEAAELLKRFM